MKTTIETPGPSLATWKFQLLETVDNDPLLGKGGACLSVMRAAINFMNTRHSRPYLPISVLMKRTGLASAACVDARKRLVTAGYLVPSGSNARGLDTFEIRNSRRVDVLTRQ
ncbi:hypothetical protein B5M44_19095 [Shinella sumterensis]|uniref:hypothetical protein n=1 Tax=Shinella sumterensis TaxID=1967501 RepID=UPI00106E881C|nr:hypothetical protein [Shinella sumterensis]MCD1266696.1 hypothetical protein [Shinella sumterensis]TFE96690.1 hypothetical protein B5M44_19095 [Shinella sumterensis]